MLLRTGAFAIAIPFVLSGCGYGFGAQSIYAYRSVALPFSDNDTERRAHEFELTHAVARQLQASGIRVNQPDATARLELTILDIHEPALVENRLDAVTVGAVEFRVRLRLLDVATGATVREETRTERASFAVARGESRDTARREVLARLSRWVATRLEKDW